MNKKTNSAKRKRTALALNSLPKEDRLEARKIAYKTWALNKLSGVRNKRQPFEAAASKAGILLEDAETLYVKDHWENRFIKDQEKGTFKKLMEEQTNNAVQHIENKKNKNDLLAMLNNSSLSERHKLFILYYLQCFNVSTAALKAGYTKHSANVAGYQIMNNPEVKEILEKAKEIMQADIYISAKTVLEQYVKIAQADITDYLEFKGRRVLLKDSDKIDGSLITEVRQGKDGVTVKLADKMKALERLEKLFNVIPDQKLLLEMQKWELQKKVLEKQLGEDNSNSKVIIINDL
jgi:phage terminase small subunit